MQSYVGPVWKPDDESNKEKSPPKFLAKRCLRMAIFGQNLATPPGRCPPTREVARQRGGSCAASVALLDRDVRWVRQQRPPITRRVVDSEEGAGRAAWGGVGP